MKISDADGEQYPKDTNWASADVPGVVATISDNIPYWKLKTQVLGGEGPGMDFAMWLGTYYYRIGGDVQPLLRSRVAVLTEDRNHDGVDRLDGSCSLASPTICGPRGNTCHEPKTFHLPSFLSIGLKARSKSHRVVTFTAVISSFAETLEIVRAVARVTGNRVGERVDSGLWMAVHGLHDDRLSGVESGERASWRCRTALSKAGERCGRI